MLKLKKLVHFFSLVKPHTLFFISYDIECREGAMGGEVSRTIMLFHVADSLTMPTRSYSERLLLKKLLLK